MDIRTTDTQTASTQMTDIRTADWEQETARLEDTKSCIRRQLEQLEDVLSERKADIIEARKHYGEIAFDPMDIEETAIDFRHHQMELDRQERVYSHAFASRKRLLLLLDSPYFGRIDFKETGSAHAEPIYVGRASLIDENTDRVLIYDWRAPISSMFYDYQLGDAAYTTPDGEVTGSIELKRQFIIQFGRLINMFDTGLHIGDRLLQFLLAQNADDKMKSIVTTIQREQNRIIREVGHKYVIVQGAAGSGKTSAAMQRAAFLLYRNRDTWKSNDILLLSPNGLFSDYVSNVLPELGEENLLQMTFQQLLEQALGPDFQVEDPFTQLESLLDVRGEDEPEARIAGIRFKASLEFAGMLDAYLRRLESEGMRFRSLEVRGKTVIGADRLEQLWYEEYSGLPLRKRVENMKKWIAAELDVKEKEFAIILYRNLLKKPYYIGTEEELKQMAKAKVRKRFKDLRQQAERLAFIDMLGLYRQWFEQAERFAAADELRSAAGDWESVRKQTLEGLRSGEIPYEDAVPLLYLVRMFRGAEHFHAVRHVMIDEAQDYSPFQLKMIRTFFPRSGMTLLGDFQQAIHAHTIGSADSLKRLRAMFPEDETLVVELTKSYRSTREIVDLSASVLPQGASIESFSRSGDRPLVIRVADRSRLAAEVANEVSALRDKGARSIAVICKTARESGEAYEQLKELLGQADEQPVERLVERETGPDGNEQADRQERPAASRMELITKYTQTFKRGIVVIPSYLAKGLEFDAVIVYDASAGVYGRERERRLFYTVCTRALHHLRLMSAGELTPFLPDPGLYDLETR